jgi:hypothetical protein
LDNFSGLQWDGAEKTYDLIEKVNLIIHEMQKDFPDFGLQGELLAQGESINDRWILNIENNVAVERRLAVTGNKVTCPHCGKEFILEESKNN